MGTPRRLPDDIEKDLLKINPNINKAIRILITEHDMNESKFKAIDYDFLSDEISRKVAERLKGG